MNHRLAFDSLPLVAAHLTGGKVSARGTGPWTDRSGFHPGFESFSPDITLNGD